MNEKQLRSAIIDILDDENGIKTIAYESLREMSGWIASKLSKEGCVDDIFDAVRATDGRFYLPENHGLE